MNLIRYNLSIKELIETVALINGDDTPVRGYVKAVYTKDENSQWRFLIGRCILTSEESSEKEEFYKEYAFVSKAVENLSLARFLADISKHGFSLAKGLPPIKVKECSLNWQEEIIPSHTSSTGVPARKFATTISTDSCFLEVRLIAFGLDFHPSSSEYLRTFMGFREFHGGSDSRRGQLSIEIDDPRGRIQLENGQLSIAGSKEELCIVGRINNGEPIIVKNDESIDIGGDSIKHLELWLVTKDNNIVDHWSSSEWPHKYPTDNDVTNYIEYLKGIICGGENETCEFKPYIELKNNKSFEIAKTVCAFSNHNGGYLFIGVDDGSEVVGLGNEIQKDFRCSLDEALILYKKGVESLLREKLKHNNCFKVEIVEIYLVPIIAVHVSRAEDLNFLLNPIDAYIRRGATSAKMTPLEVRSFGLAANGVRF